jgi:uncharacterized lipoprotein YajG
MKRLLMILASALCLTACATGTTNLTLGLTDEAAKPGLLSEIPPRTIYLAGVTDSRPADEAGRIGDKRNGYGMVMGAVGTTEPVEKVVTDTLVKTLKANGHTVVTEATEGAVKVEADVKRFWFDYKTGLVTVEFFGDVQVALKVTDPALSTAAFEQTFKGYYSDKTGGGLSKTWTRVMDAALADLSREVSLSAGLSEALEAPAPAKAAAAEPVEPAAAAEPAAVEEVVS